MVGDASFIELLRIPVKTASDSGGKQPLPSQATIGRFRLTVSSGEMPQTGISGRLEIEIAGN